MIDHPTVSTPVFHLPIAILELVINDQAAELPRLGRILAKLRALRSAGMVPTFEVVPAPSVKCKHGLREAWCASCAMLSRSGPSEQRGSLSFRFQSMRDVRVGTRNSAGCAHNGGFDTISVRRIEAGTWITGLDGAGEDFLADDTGTPPIAPCGDEKPRFTCCLECGKPRTRSQFEFCGETLLKNGTCKRTWLEKHPPECESRIEPMFAVLTAEECEQQARSWKAVHAIQTSGNFITRDFAKCKLQTNWCFDCNEYAEQEHVCDGWQEKKALVDKKHTAKMLAEHQAAGRKNEKQNVRAKERYLATLAAQGLDNPITDPMTLVKLGVLRESYIKNGGKRLSTQGRFSADDAPWSNEGGGDRCIRDYRADLIFDVKHSEKRVEKKASVCKYCGDLFPTVRKGQKFCTKNCCNRSSELTKGDN